MKINNEYFDFGKNDLCYIFKWTKEFFVESKSEKDMLYLKTKFLKLILIFE